MAKDHKDKTQTLSHVECEKDKKINELEAKIATLTAKLKKVTDTNTNLEKIMAYMPGNIYWRDIEGKYQYCNDQVAHYLGLAHRDDIKGKTIHEIMPPEYAIPANENDQRAIALRKPITFEEIGFSNQDGKQRIFLTTKAPLMDDYGKVIGVFGLALDITDRKKMELELDVAKSQAEIASLAKSEFIANMSHDLRTPFSGILGFANHLYENETDPEKKKEISFIIQSSEKLLNLINEILQTSLDDKQQKFVITTFDLVKVIEDTKQLFLAEIERKNIKCDIHCLYQKLFIHADKHRLHRVLINLLSNAIKFTDQGSINIEAVMTKENNQDFIDIRIADTGIGIPEAAFKTIFERFTRLSSAYEGKYVGTGVGLWLVKKFIDDLNGTISVESTLGKGSTFHCHIPIEVKHVMTSEGVISNNVDKHALPPQTASVNTKSNTDKLHILIVEDDEITLTMQILMLKQCHYVVQKAGTPQEALRLATQEKYDLILMDIGLPGMSGFEVAEKIKLNSLLNRNTPIVGLTAHATQSELAQCEESVLDSLMIKPLTPTVCEQFPKWLNKLRAD